MADHSNIAWTDSTFNPLIGCTKYSPGCTFCYAEELMDHRYHKVVWGPKGERTRTKPAYWKKLKEWNSDIWLACDQCGLRGSAKDVSWHVETGCPGTLRIAVRMVFVASLADIFEKHPAWVPVRRDFFAEVHKNRNLIYQLCTKRAEHILTLGSEAVGMDFNKWLADHPNVWIGASAENQKYYDERVEELGKVEAAVRWLSVEPHLGPVRHNSNVRIDWIVDGGESGAKHRPYEIEWARLLLSDCREKGTAFFMKQLGGHPDKRDKMTDFPEDLRIREFPKVDVQYQ